MYDGRSFSFDEVRNLVYRKHAYLNERRSACLRVLTTIQGLHKKLGSNEAQLLQEGRELFAADEGALPAVRLT